MRRPPRPDDLPGSAPAPAWAAARQTLIDAVTQDESQRQKVLAAIHAGRHPTEAMAKVSDGPKTEKTAEVADKRKGRRLAAPAPCCFRGAESAASVLRLCSWPADVLPLRGLFQLVADL